MVLAETVICTLLTSFFQLVGNLVRCDLFQRCKRFQQYI